MILDYFTKRSSKSSETNVTDPTQPLPKRSWLSKIGKPKLIRVAAVFACLIIIFAVGFFVLKNNNFKADVVTKTITISGNFIDIISLKPVVGASISVGFANNAPVETKTDSSGNYSASITINYDDAVENVITIQAKTQGYADGVLYATVGTTNLIENMDFKLSTIPIDTVSTKSLDPVSARCRTTIDSYDYIYDHNNIMYHPGDYKGQIIDGVLFCASEQNAVVFTNYTQDIKTTAAQINALVSRTGLSYTPTIYLTGTITWISGAAAYSDPGTKELIINVSFLNDISVITHEFGHLIDWDKGMDNQTNSTGNRCYKNKATNIPHCYLSTRNDFSKIYAYLKYYDTFIKGYAASSPFELFAELFASEQLPDSIGSDHFSARERLQYDIRNAFSGSYSDAFGATQKYKSSTINPNTFLSSVFPQNMAIYAYKFVAAAGNLDEYFQGTLNSNLTLDDIKTGKFTDKAILSINLVDQYQKPLAEALVSVSDGSASGKTLAKKSVGVFADNSGDPFDTTGTLVLQNIVVGKQTLIVKRPTGEILTSKPIDLRAGANGVVYLAIQDMGTVYNDSFDRLSDIDDTRWTKITDSSIVDSKLRIAHLGKTPASGVTNKLTVSGDFDAQVSYSNLAFSGNNFSAVGLRASGLSLPFNIERRQQGVIFSDIFSDHPDMSYAITDTSTSGIFRIKRTGSTCFVYKSDGTTVWQQRDIGTDDVTLSIYGRDDNIGGSVQADFSDFKLTNFILDILPNSNSFVGATEAKVQTLAPTGIDSSTTKVLVTPQGNVITDGGGKIIMTGFMVSTDKISSRRYNDPVLTGIGPFSRDITDLSPNTTYYIQAFAENSVGIGYGDWIEFKTPLLAPLPTVVTASSSEVTTNSVTLSGCVTAASGTIISRRGFYYHAVGSTVITAAESGSFGLDCFTQKITGLKPGTQYGFFAFVTTAGGEITNFPSMSFKTLPAALTAHMASLTINRDIQKQLTPSSGTNNWSLVNEMPADDNTSFVSVTNSVLFDDYGFTPVNIPADATIDKITVYTRTYNSQYTYPELIVEGSHEWVDGFSGGETWVTNSNSWTINPKTSAPWAVSDIANLQLSAVIGNTNGTAKLSQVYAEIAYSAPTPVVSLPTVTTKQPGTADISTSTIIPRGNINDTGGAPVTVRGFQYSKTSDGSGLASIYDSGTFDVGEYTKLPIISSLTANTTYYIRAYATNSAGTSYGDWASFKTLPQATPKVTTLPPTSITANSIVPHGNITDIGGAPVTKRGFRLTKIQNTVQADYSDTGSYGSGEFIKAPNVPLSVPDTTYYIQAYATNSAGTTYGDWVSFKSLPLALPKVTTLAPTDITFNSFMPHGNITDTGSAPVTIRGFQYNKANDSSVPASTYDSGTFSVGEYTKLPLITLSLPNMIYIVRAYATNSAGTTYGDWMSFKTLPAFTLTATASAGGVIFPSGVTNLARGSSQKYIIVPSVGYKLTDVKVDGLSVGAVLTYAFTNVFINHTIAATFALITPPSTAQGVVTSNGKVFAGATISVVKYGTTNGSSTTFYSDQNGVYKITGLSAASYYINVTAPSCTKYYIWTTCNNTQKKASFTLTSGTNTIIPTFNF
jgi:hypothetical protein